MRQEEEEEEEEGVVKTTTEALCSDLKVYKKSKTINHRNLSFLN